MPSTGIVYVHVGNRDSALLAESIRLLRRVDSKTAVTVFHDDAPPVLTDDYNIIFRKFERIRYENREENRNSSLWRLKALLESPFDVTIYLDNDVFIVNPGFTESYRIASHMGCAMTCNPRQFISTPDSDSGDLDIGADVHEYDRLALRDMPKYMTAYNMGLILYTDRTRAFIQAILQEQTDHPSRGQAALYRAIWKTGMYPYTLPVNWLVCAEHTHIPHPITLHAGHSAVLEWYNRDFRENLSK